MAAKSSNREYYCVLSYCMSNCIFTIESRYKDDGFSASTGINYRNGVIKKYAHEEQKQICTIEGLEHLNKIIYNILIETVFNAEDIDKCIISKEIAAEIEIGGKRDIEVTKKYFISNILESAYIDAKKNNISFINRKIDTQYYNKNDIVVLKSYDVIIYE